MQMTFPPYKVANKYGASKGTKIERSVKDFIKPSSPSYSPANGLPNF